MRFLAFASLLCVCLSASAPGAEIVDYTIFAVGDSTDGNSDAIYAYTDLNASPTLLIDVPSSAPNLNYVNGMASDSPRNRLLMIRDGFGGGGSNLFALDLTTLTFSNLGSINAPGISVVNSSGGGGMYNGSYYYWDDQDGGGGVNQGLIRVDFNASGTISSTSTVLLTNFGDFGDLIIDNNTGIMYAVSDSSPGSQFDLWTLDLNNVGAGRTILQTGVPYQQIAFDNDGNLVAVELQSASGAGNRFWYTVDITDGSIISTFSRPILSQPGPDFDFDVYDLSAGGLYAVPEPGTIGMLALAALGGIWWHRRRQASQPTE